MLRPLVIFFVGLAAGAAGLHLGLERPALDAAHSRIQQYDQDLAALRTRLNDATTAAAALEGRLLVEESTRRGLESSLRAAQDELGQTRNTIAFYEQLMPPGPNGAISVRALDIEWVGPNLRYRMLLMRSGSNDKPFRGELQFFAEGRLDGQETRIPLLPTVIQPAREQVAEDGSDVLAVEFSDFQRSSGFLGLPEGFVPESVTVNVLEGRALRVSRSVELAVRE